MREPLSIKELMNINENVIKDAEDIYAKYTRRFFTDKKSDKFLGLMMLPGYPLLWEAEQYYNGELISSYSIFKALRDHKTDYRINAFYLENLLFRIIAFWEYIYQFLNLYLCLQLFDYKAKKRLIELLGYTPKFIECGRGKTIKLEAKPKEEQKRLRNKLKNNIKLINQTNIINSVLSKYEVNGNFEKLIKLIANNKVEKIKEIRNQIIHQRPAGAYYTVNFDDMFNDYTVSINNDGWINLDEALRDVQECIDIISEAIQTIHEIIHLNEYPNRVENAGKKYFLTQVKCNICNKKFIVPSDLLGDNHKFISVTICPHCNNMGCKVLKTVSANEVDYGTQFASYFRELGKFQEDTE